MKFFDYHMHTNYSGDSTYLMEDLVNDAIKIGLEEICITDHVDYGIKYDWDSVDVNDEYYYPYKLNVDYPKYFGEIERLREKYKSQINIKVGLEFGMQMHTINEYEKLFLTYDFDFILLAIHQIENKQFWNNKYQEELTEEECYSRYYAELYNLVVNYKNYSVLAHLDLIRRYVASPEDTFADHKPIITKILKQVIADGKGIELNMSSERYGIDGLTPSKQILQLYNELGGKIITVGSDSHNREQLAYGVQSGISILKEIGFEYICSFDKMIPKFHKI